MNNNVKNIQEIKQDKIDKINGGYCLCECRDIDGRVYSIGIYIYPDYCEKTCSLELTNFSSSSCSWENKIDEYVKSEA